MSVKNKARTIDFLASTFGYSLLVTCCVLLLSLSQQVRPSEAAAGDLQQANQAPPTLLSTTDLPAMGANGLLPRLPNINIFISKNEIKKLLGIDSPIHYVTNGNINTYPFTFTIPLGYNQSDIIFTWQNLGQTNVNYSISLIIGNMKAVEAPLINITRSGLIPRHEQVFKITLPCSGRMTDEVDVQVLINVSGFVSVGSAGATVGDEASADDQATLLGLELPASTALAGEPSSEHPALQQRLVSHTLAIKRKKICTMQQIHIQEQPRSSVVQVTSQQQQQQPMQQPMQSRLNQTHKDSSQWLDLSATQPQPPPPLPSPPTPVPASALPVPAQAPVNAELEQSTKKLISVNLIPAPNQQQQPFSGVGGAIYKQHRPNTHSLHSNEPLRPYLDWQNLIMRPELDSAAAAARQQQQQQQQQQPTITVSSAGTSPLVLTLVALSLVVSVALVAALVLGSSSPGASMQRSPIDKLRALTGRCLMFGRRSKPTVGTKSPIAGAVISSLRVGGPKAASASANHLAKTPGYCFKSNQTTCGFYSQQQQQQQYATSAAHHYQHPPTADLLGTGYQCQQQQQQQQHYPIYHITGQNSQTTRLIWQSGNGTSPDGFTIDAGSYMPLSNAPRSDTGSLYQTIY